MIDIKKLCVSFGDKKVLENVDLTLPRTGLFCVCGPSGSGKSTLINAISSLIKFKGSIKVDGIKISELNEKESALYRLKNIGFVFQDFKLFENQSVQNNVEFPLNVLSNCGEKNKTRKCNEILKIVGLNKYNKRLCKTLSGGEKQRVAICRALINNPKMILADEPTGSLDENNGKEILKILKSFSKRALVIIVTHDLELAKSYADKIIFIKDRNIEILENYNKISINSELILSNKERQKKSPNIPIGFSINHAKQSMKTKKIRSFLSTLFMSIGLMGIGLSISFSNSISNDLKRSYSSLVENAPISIMKKQDKNLKLEPVNYDDLNDLCIKYKYDIPLRSGVGYYANFEEFFKDCNEFYIESHSKVIFLDELSIRNVNDFLAIDKIHDTFFPTLISKLDDDEIALGLTINQIRTICMYLNIEKSVNSLSSYLENNEIKVVIDLANFEWSYSDQQVFTLKEFSLTSTPYIAHSNYLFNKVVFEDNMRFPTTDTYSVNEFPWVLEKIAYLETNDKYEFIKLMRENNLTDQFLFEVCKKELFVNLFLDKTPSEINYLVAYHTPKEKFTDSEISFIKTVDKSLSNPIIYNNYGYVNYPNNFVSGFANRTYFSLSEDNLFETIENNASIEFANNEKEELLDGVVYTNFSQSFSNPVLFSSNLSGLITGRPPIDLDEIVVSSGLLKLLKNENFSNENLFIATAVQEINKNAGIFNRKYETTKLKIVGVVEEEKPTIYHDIHWTEDYFLLNNGQKAIGLIPVSISFSLDKRVDADLIVSKLRRAFPQYSIVNPLVDINKSVDSLCSAISIFILCISLVSLVISMILMSICTYLHIQDIKIEIALARCIGVNVKESIKFLYGYSIYITLFSLIVASIECTITNFIISYFSSETLMLPFQFSITYSAYLVIIFASIFLCVFTIAICSKHIRKMRPIDCLKM